MLKIAIRTGSELAMMRDGSCNLSAWQLVAGWWQLKMMMSKFHHGKYVR